MQFPKELRLDTVWQGRTLKLCLNEVQFPKELRPPSYGGTGSMTRSLNEVQFPKELRRAALPVRHRRPGLNEVQFPKELRRPTQYSPPPRTSEETSRALRARTPAQPPHPSPHLTDSAPFQRSTTASTARGSSSTGALASGDKRPLWRDRPGQADIGESLFIN